MERAKITEHLALAERHVAEGQQRIERQRQIIHELRGNGRDFATAVTMLTQFEELQSFHIRDRDRLRIELVILERGSPSLSTTTVGTIAARIF
jgi:hypothetical protein